MTTQKTAIVTLLNENHRQWKSDDMMYIHYLAFDNGDKGEYFSKTPQCFEFIQGQAATYSIEEVFRNGKTGHKIKPMGATKSNAGTSQPSNRSEAPRRPSFQNNSSGKPQRNENAIMSQHAITKSIELIACGAIHVNNLYPKALEILQWTHKFGNMSVEEILAVEVIIPVDFSSVEIKAPKSKEKNNNKNGSEKLF